MNKECLTLSSNKSSLRGLKPRSLIPTRLLSAEKHVNITRANLIRVRGYGMTEFPLMCRKAMLFISSTYMYLIRSKKNLRGFLTGQFVRLNHLLPRLPLLRRSLQVPTQTTFLLFQLQLADPINTFLFSGYQA